MADMEKLLDGLHCRAANFPEKDCSHCHYMCCSHCTEAYVAPAWLDEGKWKYCPACGAKMDGGEEDDK